MIADALRLIECESPSSDLAALADCAGLVAGLGERLLGAAPERIQVDGRTHLRWRSFDDGPRVLLLGHYDTVWPIGSLARHPATVRDGVLRGPGCVDMKAGLVLAMHALAGRPDRAGVELLITADEEIGSPTSRRLIEEDAAGCVAALVLEAAADDRGALKTARKGIAGYTIDVYGKAAHAGLNPELGVNASVELAHQIVAVAGLGNRDRGTTVTPTVLSGGTAANTVPARARLVIDVRVPDADEAERVDAALKSLRPVLPGARLEVTGGVNRPPMPPEASAGLHRRAIAVAGRLGQPAPAGVAVGGGSDGNFTAAIGVPTLDGLGAIGGGAHADDEHVLVDTMDGRVALVAALIADLRSDS
ncbi:M20 family metallopeptidase [Actinoplanes sp. NPDC089786]|uniref:M20 family metallopeptidase n=1 Tax=Actinoplanes sp. NPDC089786 TaxID=3155185 RepID=UPI003414664F